VIGPPRDLDELCESVRKGSRPRLLLFWGHQPSRDGSLGKECFSQWFPAPFELEGARFPSAEHYMMWKKARLFADEAAAARILAASSPAAAKKLGRAVRNFDDEVWVAHRFEIVVRASVAKFAQNSAPQSYLLGTKNRVLVEASPLDRIWGIGLAASDERAQNPLLWNGLNLLGFALMQARAQLASAG
jgi:ribA/ribD-fused uncharacterized protein